MTNTVKKIDESTKSEEALEPNKIKKLLWEIGDEINELENDAEGKNKEKVEEKAKEMREVIGKGIKNNWEWERVKNALSYDIKDELNKLKNEITELELKNKAIESEIPIPIIVTEHKAEDKLINLYENENKELKEKVKKLEEEIEEYRSKGVGIAKDYEVAVKAWDTAVKTGGEAGTKGFLGTSNLYAPVAGVGAGVAGAAVVVGGMVERNAERGVRMAEKTGENLTAVATKVVDKGAGVITEGMKEANKAGQNAAKFVEGMTKVGENLIKEGMSNTTKVIEKNLNIAEEAVKGGIGMKAGIISAGIGMGKDAAVAKELEIRKERIADLEKELKEKDAMIESLQKQIERQAGKTQDNLLSVIEMVTKSRSSSPALGERQ